ncbi:MAG TPA: adenylate/guanylate cyclase domain-containing protein, partial [Thermoanaerobaculia bacterium]|nr:adenylate/guanylate cyclase domain-containing protein [Thermoanaerobaculia bacterium]
ILVDVLSDGKRRVAGGRVFRPVPNDPRCHECHGALSPIRGVLAFNPIPSHLVDDRVPVLSELVREGFVHVMTARQSERLDDYFAEVVAKAPTIEGIAVFDRKAKLRYGSRVEGLDPDALARALVPGASREILTTPTGKVAFLPLRKEERCLECHHDDSPVRGALVVAFRPPEKDADPVEELESVVDSSLRTIMLSSLGRRITGFLTSFADSGAVGAVTLFDEEGRTYYTSSPPPPDAVVAAALAKRETVATFVGSGSAERVVVSQPLMNEKACRRCHGSSTPLRGVVTVSLSTGAAAALREAAVTRTALSTFAALLVILVILVVLVNRLVVSPVKEIGDAAEAVGTGNLDVLVRHADPEGDEVWRLGSRLNEMVHGLRTKHVLEQFVSRGTAEAAHGAARTAEGLADRATRREMTILFSDVRDFTSLSERIPAEGVVTMLNRVLEAQAKVVARHDGDIDKFVGDELMALFEGKDAPARAVLCAVEMIEAVDRVRRSSEDAQVGIGVSSGEVVYGAVGARNRMDFTAIGDAVNIGARLCGAAPAGEVVVTAAVYEAAATVSGLVFDELPPLLVKGKREPLRVFSVKRAE